MPSAAARCSGFPSKWREQPLAQQIDRCEVDLGPSGSDDFTALKERYGFTDIRDWHVVADYRGPFEYWPGGERGETNPRNPRHFNIIEGGRKRVSTIFMDKDSVS